MTEEAGTDRRMETGPAPRVWFNTNLFNAGNVGDMRLYTREIKAHPEAGASDMGRRFEVSDLELALADGTTREGAEFARICPDFLITQDGVPVVTKALRDLLTEFDMGANHLVECRFMDWQRTVYRPERFWILSVAEWKSGVDLKANAIGSPFKEGPNRTVLSSDNVLEPSTYDETYYYNIGMDRRNGGGFALKSHVAEGADLWRDPLMADKTVFLSDRLKRAIEGAKLRFKSRPRFFPNVLT